VLVPLCVVLYVLLQRRRRQRAAAYGNFGFTQTQGGSGLGIRRHIPPALFLVGLTVLVVSLARPQALVALPKIEGTVILAFDVSGSMAADDFKPTRMEAAKTAARDFIQRQPPGVLIGVVAFSDGGFAIQVPTIDRTAIEVAINRLTPERGTAVGQGIIVALNTLSAKPDQGPKNYSSLTPEPTATPTAVPQGTFAPAAIVLLSDGENNENPNPMAAAQSAADRGVRIYTIGVGSPSGVTLKVNGFTVHTQLDEATLQQIAQTTNGLYFNAANENDLRTIYDNLSPQLVIKPERTEITALFAGASILILLIGGMASLIWFSRLP